MACVWRSNAPETSGENLWIKLGLSGLLAGTFHAELSDCFGFFSLMILLFPD